MGPRGIRKNRVTIQGGRAKGDWQFIFQFVAAPNGVGLRGALPGWTAEGVAKIALRSFQYWEMLFRFVGDAGRKRIS